MSDPLEITRKRLRFRAWHRGTKELDLLVGRFADAQIADFSAAELQQFEALLTLPEPVLYDWLLGRGLPPSETQSDVLDRLIAATRGSA